MITKELESKLTDLAVMIASPKTKAIKKVISTPMTPDITTETTLRRLMQHSSINLLLLQLLSTASAIAYFCYCVLRLLCALHLL